MLRILQRILGAALLALFATQAIAWATDLTGTFHKPDGTPVSGKLIFLLSQPARLSDSSAQVVPMVKIFTVSNGQLESGAFIYGNDVLVPAGTHYLVRLVDDSNNLLFEQKWSIQGATLDLGTMTPTTTGVVLPDPLVKNTTTDQAVQGPVTFSGGITTASLLLGGNLGPTADGVFDLGSGTSRWREIHAEQWAGRIHPGTTGGFVTPTASAPVMSQESATGGSIADGTYYCVTTLVNLNGETTPSPQQSLTISAGTGTAQINLALTGREWYTGAPWFKVYCGTTDGGPYFLQSPKTHTFTMDNNTVRRRPSSVSVSGSLSRTSNIVSVTTSAAHGMIKGETFQVTGSADSTYNGTFIVVSAPTTTTLTYFKEGADGTSAGGTVTPSLANFVTLTLTGTASLGVSNGKRIVVSGATGCTDNPNGTFRVYSHTAVASPASSSITFKHTGANESGCGGAGITVTWSSGFEAEDVGTATNLTKAHLVRGSFIMTSIAGSGANPPSTNTAAIDDVQVALNATRTAASLAAGFTPRAEKWLQLAEGNDSVSAVSKMFYGLTTPLVLSTNDRIAGVGGLSLDATLSSGTVLWCRVSGTGAGVNALWNQVYDNIGCVMIINSHGTTIENVNISSPTHSVFIFMSESDAEASNNIILRDGVYATEGTGANCPAALRIASRIYYFRTDRISLVPSSTTDCFATSGHPRGAALMLSQGAGSEWVFSGPARWTVPAKHDFIQNRMGPTDPDRGVNRAGFPQRNSLVFQNMGHFQATAGGGTGIPCRCENVSITFNSTPGTADYNVSAGTDAAYIFGSNSYGASPTIRANEYSFLSIANNAATITFTSNTPVVNLAFSGISNAASAAIHFQDFTVPVKAVYSDVTTGIGLCDPRVANHLVRRSTAPTSGSNAVTCIGTGTSNTADRREYAHYIQGGIIRQGFRANPSEARIWESWAEGGTGLNFHRADPDTPSNRFMQWDTAAINFYGADGSSVIQRINKASGLVEFPNSAGTAPFSVTSPTEVPNLNPQLWRGKQALDFSAALDFPSIAAQACAELTIAASGASAGSSVATAWPAALEAGILGIMRVSSAGTVTVRLCNVSASAIDPASQTFAGRIIQ